MLKIINVHPIRLRTQHKLLLIVISLINLKVQLGLHLLDLKIRVDEGVYYISDGQLTLLIFLKMYQSRVCNKIGPKYFLLNLRNRILPVDQR